MDHKWTICFMLTSQLLMAGYILTFCLTDLRKRGGALVGATMALTTFAAFIAWILEM